MKNRYLNKIIDTGHPVINVHTPDLYSVELLICTVYGFSFFFLRVNNPCFGTG